MNFINISFLGGFKDVSWADSALSQDNCWSLRITARVKEKIQYPSFAVSLTHLIFGKIYIFPYRHSDQQQTNWTVYSFYAWCRWFSLYSSCFARRKSFQLPSKRSTLLCVTWGWSTEHASWRARRCIREVLTFWTPHQCQISFMSFINCLFFSFRPPNIMEFQS